jgi:hypothetical protein
MKKTFSILFFSFIILQFGCGDNLELKVTDQQKNEMRKTASDFSKELKAVLLNQMQSNGVAAALSVCSDTAQVLTNNFGLQRGVYLKRISFRNRNENNYPDKFEGKILSKFSGLYNNNELDENTDHIEIVEENENTYLRYLKPILVQAECLNCHGSEKDIAEPVSKLITQNYHKDKARNYIIGDFRGALSIKKLID